MIRRQSSKPPVKQRWRELELKWGRAKARERAKDGERQRGYNRLLHGFSSFLFLDSPIEHTGIVKAARCETIIGGGGTCCTRATNRTKSTQPNPISTQPRQSVDPLPRLDSTESLLPLDFPQSSDDILSLVTRTLRPGSA